MIVSRRDVLRLSGLGVAGIVASACGGASSAPAAAEGGFGEISMQLSWIKNIEFGGEYMADSKGYYTEAGFDAVDLVSGRIAAPAAFLGAILAEYLGSGGDSTLGRALIAAQTQSDAPQLWYLALVSGLISGIGYLLVGVVARIVTPWTSA
ncbi:hypothetical protein ACVGOW_28515 [Pseudonocardia saturnea]